MAFCGDVPLKTIQTNKQTWKLSPFYLRALRNLLDSPTLLTCYFLSLAAMFWVVGWSVSSLSFVGCYFLSNLFVITEWCERRRQFFFLWNYGIMDAWNGLHEELIACDSMDSVADSTNIRKVRGFTYFKYFFPSAVPCYAVLTPTPREKYASTQIFHIAYFIS
jgi:hypothetical protein